MMNHLLRPAGPMTEWLWTTTWQSAVLMAIILIMVQGVLGRRLAPRWRHALWLLLMARLMGPCFPESHWSIFNLTETARKSHAPLPTTGSSQKSAGRAPFSEPQPAFGHQTDTTESPVKAPSAADRRGLIVSRVSGPEMRDRALIPGLLTIWVAGIIAFTARLWFSLRRLRSGLRTRQPDVDATVERVLRECQKQMGVRGCVRLRQTAEVSSPALCGLWRPRLLLPEKHQLTLAELRFVFLHELAHVRRGDIALNWAATLLQIVHWFNPLVWLAFRRMRADRELASDAAVLSVIREEENQAYGETIIKLLESFSQSPARPALVGIMEDKNQMKRRIHMIANYKKTGRWSVCAGLLLPLIGALTLTQARTEKPVEAMKISTGVNESHAELSPTHRITVSIHKNSPYLYLATNAISAGDLQAELENEGRKNPRLLLEIRAEVDAPFGQIVAVLDLAKKVGIARVTFYQAMAVAEKPESKATADIDPLKDPDSESTDQTVLIRRLKLLDREKTIGSLNLSATQEALKQMRLQYTEDNPIVNQCKAEIEALETRAKALAVEEQAIATRIRDFVLHPKLAEVVQHPTPPFTRYFVRLVADLGALTFEGQSTAWQDLPDLLGQVSNRPQTVLELAAATDDMTLRQLKEAETKSRLLAAQYRFEYLSLIGVQPLRSKGLPPQEVTRTESPAASVSQEPDRRPRFVYVTGDVLKPGSIPMLEGNQYTVFDALGLAGGVTRAANKSKMELIRQGRSRNLNLHDLQNIKDTNQIIYLEPGDTINVPQSIW